MPNKKGKGSASESSPGSSSDGAQSEGISVEWETGSLARLWEEDRVLRARGRETKALTKWSNPKVRGIPSMKAINLNAELLLHVARVWCPLVPQAKSPPIPLLRKEAGLLDN